MQLVRVGLCAFGMSGKVFHAPFLKQHPGFFMSAIVERSKEESKKLYPDAKIYRSVEEMIKEANIDLVVVNTPVQTHFDFVKMALEHGKNVIVEKPFTVDLAQAEALTKLALEKNLFVSVYQNRRFDRDFKQVQKVLSEGKLGQIKEAEIRFDRYRTTPSGKSHKENPSQEGAGALHDLGSHLIDQAVQLFGFPEKVFADIFSMKGAEYANDYFEILLYYPKQLRVRLKASVFVKEDVFSYKIHGDKGSLLQERSDQQEQELVSGAFPIYGKEWTKALEKDDAVINYFDEKGQNIRKTLKSEAGNYMNFYQEIYEYMVFDNKLPSPAFEIVKNMKIIDTAIESALVGKVITFEC